MPWMSDHSKRSRVPFVSTGLLWIRTISSRRAYPWSGFHGRPDAAELPVAAERGRLDLFGGARLRADVVADRLVALDDRVAERAEALDLDLDHVARLDRTRVRGRPGQDHVTRLQRDRAGDIRDEVRHVPDHLVG